MKAILILIAAAAAFAGCATAPEELPSDKDLYEEAKELQDRADYDGAREKFNELVATYPASAYSQQGMLDLAHLHYQRGEYESAQDAADRFMLAYPDHDGAGYALYLKGLAFFQEDQNIIDRIGFQDPTERNPESMRQAFAAFKQLVERHPDSEYAEDASQRMRYLINALSRGEVHIAKFYLRRGAPVAAIGRAKRVLENYPDSAATEEAMEVLARAYQFMGAEEELQKTLRLLELNFPDNEFLRDRASIPKQSDAQEIRKVWETEELESSPQESPPQNVETAILESQKFPRRGESGELELQESREIQTADIRTAETEESESRESSESRNTSELQESRESELESAESVTKVLTAEESESQEAEIVESIAVPKAESVVVRESGAEESSEFSEQDAEVGESVAAVESESENLREAEIQDAAIRETAIQESAVQENVPQETAIQNAEIREAVIQESQESAGEEEESSRGNLTFPYISFSKEARQDSPAEESSVADSADDGGGRDSDDPCRVPLFYKVLCAENN